LRRIGDRNRSLWKGWVGNLKPWVKLWGRYSHPSVYRKEGVLHTSTAREISSPQMLCTHFFLISKKNSIIWRLRRGGEENEAFTRGKSDSKKGTWKIGEKKKAK